MTAKSSIYSVGGDTDKGAICKSGVYARKDSCLTTGDLRGVSGQAYFGITEVLSPLREIDKWVRRRLRCYAWKQWGSAGYRELRKRGVSVREAWNTSKSAHGPWRLSKTPALNLALPAKLFRQMGLPELAPAKAA